MKDLQQLLRKLTDALLVTGHKVATAESCTGGLLAGLLTELPGSSKWFERGFVSYSNLAKQELLGVEEALITNHGAVSEEVAKSMAEGALQNSQASLAVAITGIAGPDGGSSAKPVGTVWLAFSQRNRDVQSQHFCFSNSSRQQVRLLSCQQALLGLISLVENPHFPDCC